MLCFRKIHVAKKFMDKRGGGREGGRITIFHQKFFLSHSAEKFRRGTLFVSIISGLDEFYASKAFHNFLSKIFFFSQSRKTPLGNPSVCH